VIPEQLKPGSGLGAINIYPHSSGSYFADPGEGLRFGFLLKEGLMKIICNGEERFVDEKTRLSGFLQDLGLDADTVVVEYNGRIISKEEYGHWILEEGAVLELIRFVGGG
jgi:sulfur carrier protein